MDAWMHAWLTDKLGDRAQDPANVRVEDLGLLTIDGPLAVWHPMDDLYTAPRIPFGAAPRAEAVWVGEELAGYVFRASGTPLTWHELGDASTSADRFFLVPLAQAEAAIEWFNEILLAFEQLGGDALLQTVEHRNGARLVVIGSPDGNARVRAGMTSDGLLACVVIDT